jgi:hypothetical protein
MKSACHIISVETESLNLQFIRFLNKICIRRSTPVRDATIMA